MHLHFNGSSLAHTSVSNLLTWSEQPVICHRKRMQDIMTFVPSLTTFSIILSIMLLHWAEPSSHDFISQIGLASVFVPTCPGTLSLQILGEVWWQ